MGNPGQEKRKQREGRGGGRLGARQGSPSSLPGERRTTVPHQGAGAPRRPARHSLPAPSGVTWRQAHHLRVPWGPMSSPPAPAAPKLSGQETLQDAAEVSSAGRVTRHAGQGTGLGAQRPGPSRAAPARAPGLLTGSAAAARAPRAAGGPGLPGRRRSGSLGDGGRAGRGLQPLRPPGAEEGGDPAAPRPPPPPIPPPTPPAQAGSGARLPSAWPSSLGRGLASPPRSTPTPARGAADLEGLNCAGSHLRPPSPALPFPYPQRRRLPPPPAPLPQAAAAPTHQEPCADGPVPCQHTTPRPPKHSGNKEREEPV